MARLKRSQLPLLLAMCVPLLWFNSHFTLSHRYSVGREIFRVWQMSAI